jgi:hypothetical protein
VQIKAILPLAAVHTLGNLLTNVSLGKVAVSFTHTIKVSHASRPGRFGNRKCVSYALLKMHLQFSGTFTYLQRSAIVLDRLLHVLSGTCRMQRVRPVNVLDRL